MTVSSKNRDSNITSSRQVDKLSSAHNHTFLYILAGGGRPFYSTLEEDTIKNSVDGWLPLPRRWIFHEIGWDITASLRNSGTENISVISTIFVDSRLAENHGFLQILGAASSLVLWKIIEKVQLLYSSTCWHWQSFIRKMNGWHKGRNMVSGWMTSTSSPYKIWDIHIWPFPFNRSLGLCNITLFRPIAVFGGTVIIMRNILYIQLVCGEYFA